MEGLFWPPEYAKMHHFICTIPLNHRQPIRPHSTPLEVFGHSHCPPPTYFTYRYHPGNNRELG